jgi:glycosyltransferase involved in cell wall biosynthesis
MNALSETPLVSIITPVYNGSQYIEELILSVLNQDYPNIEHIIIDDGSTDNGMTVAVLIKYPHLRWWSRGNKGQYATLNEGFSSAKGEIVTTISADDVYASPKAVSTVVRALQCHPEFRAVYGYTIMCDETMSPLPVQPPRKLPMWTLPSYLHVAHCSLFLRAEITADEKFRFDETLRYRGDQKWILQIASAGYRFLYVNQPIALYRFHSMQVTQTANNPARQAEDKKMDLLFSINPNVKMLVRRYIALRQWFLMAAWAFRTGGACKLYHHLCQWLHRTRPDAFNPK